MCKHIKDILFPLNILGKKKKSFDIAITDYSEDAVFEIEWTGERLDICWTSKFRRGKYHESHQERRSFTNGNNSLTEITIEQRQESDLRKWAEAIYFNCTNVTKLIINGEQYI